MTTLHDFGGVLKRPTDTSFWALIISWSRLLGLCMKWPSHWKEHRTRIYGVHGCPQYDYNQINFDHVKSGHNIIFLSKLRIFGGPLDHKSLLVIRHAEGDAAIVSPCTCEHGNHQLRNSYIWICSSNYLLICKFCVQ